MATNPSAKLLFHFEIVTKHFTKTRAIECTRNEPKSVVMQWYSNNHQIVLYIVYRG